ncbi:bacteriocin, lactococcin 972 family protein [Streptococcus equi]|uniref:Bacteriocin n=1 Tax=Streptococcus equi subsp. zooepidemicus TaxID=40041 RepID=A0A7Z8ZV43_STRSZ|nr:bacteriocin, lactococcin 972 family protein [Streptococcus equi]MCD3391577.1 bacteriocin, lactococcin 972 family protein [Streptococcus equi subsp. zooepidemicus]WOK56776.1 bacteriocin, lactococcin 972 family protein [Streptococcus equi subsp. zooepidemicus]VEF05170.1 Uncharacterised protein [Streptococcus equi subsp. zooepidemicus]HEL1074941.1 bacteriocin, lactococcin 972 family protein [Streptococcus equi subsp. zooepidemicus]HEL1148904.1 bacteriocin, lactococcin 972 family protein [Strep
MKRSVKWFMSLGLVGAFVVAGISNVNAETRHPHPKYKDTWEFGITSDNWAYSNYFLEAPIRLGSSASVTDFWGNVKSRDSQNYGWARAGAKKQWSWVQAKSFYGWYNF